jgi:hypothetical protein
MEADATLATDRRVLIDHHRRHGAKGLDAAIFDAIARSPRFDHRDLELAASVLRVAVSEALASRECKDRRALERAWVVGWFAGAAARDFDPAELAYMAGYNGLHGAVGAGNILAVFAFSLSWSVAQVWHRQGWPPELKPKLLASLERGLHDAEVHLAGEVQSQESRWMRENLGTGWRAGAVLARLFPGGRLGSADAAAYPP